MNNRKINVLVAEDSSVTRILLVHLLESDPQICVAGVVGDGQAAIDFIKRNKPDVVLMDIHMPRMDGFEATRRIMETLPVPIVICSATFDTKDVAVTFRAMQVGAIACIEKPVGPGHADFETMAAHLVQTVKLMSEIKVVRRVPRARTTAPALTDTVQVKPPAAQVRVIGIGASTGGPPVLQAILADLPADFAAPILIVQHIAAGFLQGMAEWLARTSKLQVRIASDGEYPLAGNVYLAPDDAHMGIGMSGAIALHREEREHHVRPAVSFLFRSLAASCGPNAVGVLLTGMGSDGAQELKTMKDRGATTIAQDRESSVVHGMPGVAIALGGATHVLAAEKIAAALVSLLSGRTSAI